MIDYHDAVATYRAAQAVADAAHVAANAALHQWAIEQLGESVAGAYVSSGALEVLVGCDVTVRHEGSGWVARLLPVDFDDDPIEGPQRPTPREALAALREVTP